MKTEGNEHCPIDVSHIFIIEHTDTLFKSSLVESTYLFEKDYRIFCQTELPLMKFDMSGQFCFGELACDRGHNDGGRIFVANIVLNDKDGAHAALFGADDGR